LSQITQLESERVNLATNRLLIGANL